MAGKTVVTPKPNIKWNKLGELYQSFYDEYKELALEQLLDLFNNIKMLYWLHEKREKGSGCQSGSF
jgi:hypothetical protein